jgi:lipooligosaccharide transport system permease protein
MISRRFMKIWQRNLLVYKREWHINFLPPLLEPFLYILAFGVGMGSLIGKVRFQGELVPYIRFIAPALIAIAIMYGGFFENTYASFVRMYYQKTFDAMLATPLFIEEIITGEIVWGATKSVIATAIMTAVISFFGLLDYPQTLLLVPVAFLGGLAFGSLGMFFTGIVPSIEMFNLPVFLFITPMFLFGGTFFPIEALPGWAQKTAMAFPLTHLVILVRSCSYGALRPALLWSVLYLAVFSLLWFPVALFVMRRRLIK